MWPETWDTCPGQSACCTSVTMSNTISPSEGSRVRLYISTLRLAEVRGGTSEGF